MTQIMLSICHKYAEEILSGAKDLEIRKSCPRSGYPYIVFLYEAKTGGTGKVVGHFIMECSIISFIPPRPSLMEQSEYEGRFLSNIAERAGITVRELIPYIRGHKLHAWVISQPKRYQSPLSLSDFGIKNAPRGWRYLK